MMLISLTHLHPPYSPHAGPRRGPQPPCCQLGEQLSNSSLVGLRATRGGGRGALNLLQVAGEERKGQGSF